MGMKKKLNNKRQHTGGGSRPDNRKHRQEEAQERLEAWQKLSPQQQLKQLDARFGEGKGAAKQRTRLASLADKATYRTSRQADAVPPPAEADVSRAKDRWAQERQGRPSNG